MVLAPELKCDLQLDSWCAQSTAANFTPSGTSACYAQRTSGEDLRACVLPSSKPHVTVTGALRTPFKLPSHRTAGGCRSCSRNREEYTVCKFKWYPRSSAHSSGFQVGEGSLVVSVASGGLIPGQRYRIVPLARLIQKVIQGKVIAYLVDSRKASLSHVVITTRA